MNEHALPCAVDDAEVHGVADRRPARRGVTIGDGAPRIDQRAPPGRVVLGQQLGDRHAGHAADRRRTSGCRRTRAAAPRSAGARGRRRADPARAASKPSRMLSAMQRREALSVGRALPDADAAVRRRDRLVPGRGVRREIGRRQHAAGLLDHADDRVARSRRGRTRRGRPRRSRAACGRGPGCETSRPRAARGRRSSARRGWRRRAGSRARPPRGAR